MSSQLHFLSRQMLDIYLDVADGKEDGAAARVAVVRNTLTGVPDPAAWACYDKFARLIALHLPPGTPPPGQPSVGGEGLQGEDVFIPERIPHLGLPGISLVTCSMNRTENLIRALPSWLSNPEITEIVIVDWSSREPVADALAAAGMWDPRIRIIRVDGEPRWILSYAFNTGFRFASSETILKVDADIVLSGDFFARNADHLAGSFVAGNWRVAEADQAHVNGFFLAPRAALAAVGGFNEYITTYGWDDDDIYDRLEKAGFRRKDVCNGTIFHLPHDDEERTESVSADASRTARQALLSSPRFLIQRNRLIAEKMPVWTAEPALLPLKTVRRTARLVTLTRAGQPHQDVPDQVFNAATDEMLRELSAWDHGPKVRELSAEVFALVMARPAHLVCRLDFDLAVAAPDHLARDDKPYLLITPEPGSPTLDATEEATLHRVIGLARRHGYHCVISGSGNSAPTMSPGSVGSLPSLPHWQDVGMLSEVSLQDLSEGRLTASSRLRLTAATRDVASLSAPSLIARRRRLFIDGQHGLGNRLRAIGSAAAIARETGRELVIVWQPDDHCDCRFHDLFEYDGAVIEKSFPEDKAGYDVHNYMPMEGGDKDAHIRTEGPGDIYARSAFILHHPASTWEAENGFLQALRPVEAVRDLVASVRNPNEVSVHVRMEAGPGLDHNSYDRPENWGEEDHRLIHEWRSKSHFSHFMARLDTLIAEGRAKTIFLAADLPQTYAEFTSRFGHRIACLPRSRYDRSAEQLHYALADAILLSRAPLILGSTWSSFSELAMRLARGGIKVEMSGKDF